MDTETTATSTDVARTLGDTGTTPPPWQRWIKWGVAALIIFAVLVFLRLRGGEDETRYVTQEVTKGDMIVTVTATGNLEPRNQVDIGSEVSAYRGRGVLRALGTIAAWSGPDAQRPEPVWHAYAWRRDGAWSRIPEIDVPKADVRSYLEAAVPIARTELTPEQIEELRALGYVVEH